MSRRARTLSITVAPAPGISEPTRARVVRAGLAEPVTPGANVFTAAMLARLRRMLRLRTDLGVNLVGAAIIVDLTERLDELYEQSQGRS